MAFLAPAAAAAGTGATVGMAAPALAKMGTVAATTGTALSSGLAAGTALGSGVSMAAMPALSYAGSSLAAPTLAAKGLAGTGLKALGGAGGQTLIGAGGKTLGGTAVKSLAATKPASFSAINQATGLGQAATTQAAPTFTKATYATKGAGSTLAPTTTTLAPTTTTAPKSLYDISTASNAAQYQSALRPAASFVDDAGMAVADPRAEILGRSIRPEQNFLQNLTNIGSFQDLKDYAVQHPYATSAAVGLGAMGLTNAMKSKGVPTPESNAMIRPYTYERTQRPEAYEVSPGMDSSERLYFNDQFVAGEPYRADQKAEGGIASAYAVGGPVEQMAAMNSVGMNTGYPMAGINTPMYSNPMMQRPEATNVIAPSIGAGVGAYSGEQRFAEGGETKIEGGYRYSYDPNTMQFTQLSVPTVTPVVPPRVSNMGGSGSMGVSTPPPRPVTNSGSKISGGIAAPAMGPTQTQAAPINIPAYRSPEQQLGLTDFYNMMNQQLAGYGGYAAGGGISGEPTLGSYSDGGRLLKGPGDGVSDSIPAVIGKRQPARLADGEFVIPARIVSELGNGSTEAGARKLYAMMDRIQKGRRKSIGKGKVAVNSKADKHLPA